MKTKTSTVTMEIPSPPEGYEIANQVRHGKDGELFLSDNQWWEVCSEGTLSTYLIATPTKESK